MKGFDYAKIVFCQVLQHVAQSYPKLKPIYASLISTNSGKEAEYLALDSQKANLELYWKVAWTQHEAIDETLNWWRAVSETPDSATRVRKKTIEFRLAKTAF